MPLQHDPADQPEPEGWGLVIPFVVCQSQGGPYEDESFVAGFQAGQIYAALAAAAAVGATSARYTVRTALLPLLELIGMHHRFPTVASETHDGYPEWAEVAFVSSGGGS